MNELNINIKAVVPSQLKELQDFSRKTFCDAFAKYNTEENIHQYLESSLSTETLRAALDNPYIHFFFLYKDNNIAAYIKLNEGPGQSDINDDDSLELERIYVAEVYQNQSFGEILIQKAIAYAKELNKKYLWLGVWDQNVRAAAFYERIGFERIGQHHFYLGDEEQIDYIMRLDI